jgi:hypothetical protein
MLNKKRFGRKANMRLVVNKLDPITVLPVVGSGDHAAKKVKLLVEKS